MNPVYTELGLTVQQPEIETLFLNPAELQKALSQNERDQNDQNAFSAQTLDTFGRAFKKIRELSGTATT